MGEQDRATASSDTRKHVGSCHCGAIRFEVELDTSKPASRCNCSVCTKVAQTASIVPPSAFVLRSPPEESLGRYEWGGRVSTRFFCKQCGIHCYARGHLAQLGGDYVSVNLNCIDDLDPGTFTVVYWDGRHDNWQSGPKASPWPITP